MLISCTKICKNAKFLGTSVFLILIFSWDFYSCAVFISLQDFVYLIRPQRKNTITDKPKVQVLSFQLIDLDGTWGLVAQWASNCGY